MEPIQHKKLSIALMLGGVLLAGIGIVLLITSSRLAGVCLLLLGSIMFLIGLPTMIVLAGYTAKQEMNKMRK